MVRLPDLAMPEPVGGIRLDASMLHAVQAAAARVSVPDDVLALIEALRAHLRDQKVYVSDRRWRKVLKLLRVSAVTNGRDAVSVWDAWLLQHCTWTKPDERGVVCEWYRGRVGTADPVEPERLKRLFKAYHDLLDKEREGRSQARDNQGRLLWLGAKGEVLPEPGERQRHNDQGQPLYLAPPKKIGDRTKGGAGYTKDELQSFFDQYQSSTEVERHIANAANALLEKRPPQMEPTRYSRPHIEGRVGEIDRIASEIQKHLDVLRRRRTDIEAQVVRHLWLEDGFATTATEALDRQIESLARLGNEVVDVRKGVAALPPSED
jgi:MoxR-like ATPase